MRAVLQRVRRAAVHVDDQLISAIGRGLLIFLGVEKDDGAPQLETMVRKVTGLRIFEDDAGKMNLSCEVIGGEFLVVSQFTLAADLARGKRPGFDNAMRPPESERLYEAFCSNLAESAGRPVKRGKFGAKMLVEIENEGPATFLLSVIRDS